MKSSVFVDVIVKSIWFSPHEYSLNFIIYSETNEKKVNFVDGHPVVHVSQSFFIWREIHLALEKKNNAQKFSLSHMSIFSESPCNIC